MKQQELFKFDRNQAYRLVGVTDKEGNDKVHSRELYKERIGCVAVDFHYYNYSAWGDKYILQMRFVQNEDGLYCNKTLNTSFVDYIEGTETGIKVITYNSIYIFERAELKEISRQDNSNLIELFLDAGSDYLFGKAFYYDKAGTQHELEAAVHVGMFQDSVMVCFKTDDALSGCTCRYFPKDNAVVFYDTIYNQQEYSTPMLIHNTGKKDLVISFEMYFNVWTIKPSESKRIIPYLA